MSSRSSFEAIPKWLAHVEQVFVHKINACVSLLTFFIWTKYEINENSKKSQVQSFFQILHSRKLLQLQLHYINV